MSVSATGMLVGKVKPGNVQQVKYPQRVQQPGRDQVQSAKSYRHFILKPGKMPNSILGIKIPLREKLLSFQKDYTDSDKNQLEELEQSGSSTTKISQACETKKQQDIAIKELYNEKFNKKVADALIYLLHGTGEFLFYSKVLPDEVPEQVKTAAGMIKAAPEFCSVFDIAKDCMELAQQEQNDLQRSEDIFDKKIKIVELEEGLNTLAKQEICSKEEIESAKESLKEMKEKLKEKEQEELKVKKMEEKPSPISDLRNNFLSVLGNMFFHNQHIPGRPLGAILGGLMSSHNIQDGVQNAQDLFSSAKGDSKKQAGESSDKDSSAAKSNNKVANALTCFLQGAGDGAFYAKVLPDTVPESVRLASGLLKAAPELCSASDIASESMLTDESEPVLSNFRNNFLQFLGEIVFHHQNQKFSTKTASATVGGLMSIHNAEGALESAKKLFACVEEEAAQKREKILESGKIKVPLLGIERDLFPFEKQLLKVQAEKDKQKAKDRNKEKFDKKLAESFVCLMQGLGDYVFHKAVLPGEMPFAAKATIGVLQATPALAKAVQGATSCAEDLNEQNPHKNLVLE